MKEIQISLKQKNTCIEFSPLTLSAKNLQDKTHHVKSQHVCIL